VGLASRGLRNLDQGDERITDFTVRLALRRRGQKMTLLGAGIAALLTAGVWLI